MLDTTEVKWPSDAHRIVAEKVLLGNCRYDRLSDLTTAARIIASIPEDKIKLITGAELAHLGILIG
jgi:homoaconitase/3-isopropylmalate dehydratase large subunit